MLQYIHQLRAQFPFLLVKKEILISDVVGKGHVISYLITEDRMCNLQDHRFYLAN